MSTKLPWLRKGAYVMSAADVLCRVVWVAPEPLQVFLVRSVKDYSRSLCFQRKERGRAWFPSDRSGRKRLGDQDLEGKARRDSMNDAEKAELWRRIVSAVGLDKPKTGRVPIECEHGFDCCPKCDKPAPKRARKGER
jgi:hypothetical protein